MIFFPPNPRAACEVPGDRPNPCDHVWHSIFKTFPVLRMRSSRKKGWGAGRLDVIGFTLEFLEYQPYGFWNGRGGGGGIATSFITTELPAAHLNFVSFSWVGFRQVQFSVNGIFTQSLLLSSNRGFSYAILCVTLDWGIPGRKKGDAFLFWMLLLGYLALRKALR